MECINSMLKAWEHHCPLCNKGHRRPSIFSILSCMAPLTGLVSMEKERLNRVSSNQICMYLPGFD